MAASPERLEAIDALRGIAFLGVLLVHAGQAAPDFPGKELTRAGSFGVALFFIASAFTLLTSHRHRLGQEPAPTRSFFIRRVFRIVPLFWAGILLYYVIYGTWDRGWAEGPLGWFHYGTTALLLHGWHPDTINSVVPGGWSIAAEFGFYLLAPALFVVISNRPRAVVAYAVALLMTLAASILIRNGDWLERLYPDVASWRQISFTYLWLPFHLPTFTLGFLAYYLMDDYRSLSRVLQRVCLIAICASLVAGAIFVPLRLADFLFPALLAAFVVALIADPARLFVNRWTCALGVVSFSAYITHFAAIKVVAKLLKLNPSLPPVAHFLILFLGGLALTGAASFVTYRWIEQPGIALGRKLLKHMRPPSTSSLPAHVVR
jgi:peptidoglycan/LPS O-acetylase OafA/YrhL